MDSVRRDHLSCYGHTRPTSPFLERLAAEGRVYGNAYSTSCWTVPSHASMLTGLHPVAHGAHWENLHLSERVPTLADVLGEHGYETAYFSENSFICPKRGFGRGFDVAKMLIEADAIEEGHVLRECSRYFTDRHRAPFFAFINLNIAHKPYDAAGPFDGCFLSNKAYRGMNRHPYLTRWLTGTQQYTPEALVHLAECYDEEIRRVDSTIESLVEALKKARQWESTTFIVTADHGENLGDHGLLDHQLCLYETLVRVPLIVRCPGLILPDSREDNPVQLTDLFPTVLEAADVDPRDHRHQGIGLASGILRRDRPVFCELYEHEGYRVGSWAKEWSYPELQQFRRRLRALVLEDRKLIEGSDGSQEFYDLAEDPGEGYDAASDDAHGEEKTRLTDVLHREAEKFSALAVSNSPSDQEDVPDAMEDLDEIGYL